jgi:hypothetical protein
MNRTVKATEAEFWDAFGGFCAPGGFFDVQGRAQREIDRRLVAAVDALLVARLGCARAGAKWRHQFDAYRDGIVSLLFAAPSFDPALVPSLQALLVGEHEHFCILCEVLPSLGAAEALRIGSVAIRANRLLVSYPLVKHLDGQV